MDFSKFDSEEVAHLFAIEARLMDDIANPPRVPIHAIYLMTHGEHYERNIMDKGIERYYELREKGDSPAVLFCAEEPASSFRGGEVWARYLQSHIPASDLIPLRGAVYLHKGKPTINSFTEVLPALQWMNTGSFRNLEIVALPFHVQRSFVGFATEILAMRLPINAFARVTGHVSFTKPSVHSQGTQEGTASQFAEAEIEKIFSYMNLTSPSEVMRYLDERDARIA